MTVAFVRLSSLGDVVLATAFARAAADAFRGARLIAVTRSEYAAAFTLDPHVELWTVGVAVPAGGKTARAFETDREAASALKQCGADVLFDLHGKPRTMALARAASARRTVTYAKRSVSRRLAVWTGLQPATTPSVGQAYLDCLAAFGHPARFGAGRDGAVRAYATLWRTSAAERAEAARRLAPNRIWVALAPGAAQATKRWPLPHYAALASALSRQGIGVALVGDSAETALARQIAARVPAAVDATGIPLGATAAVLERCRALVTGDSGLMHVAEAVGRPVVALFGPTTSAFGFRPYRPDSTVLERALPCRPCSLHGGPACPLGHHACMDTIPVAAVRREVLKRLEPRGLAS